MVLKQIFGKKLFQNNFSPRIIKGTCLSYIPRLHFLIYSLHNIHTVHFRLANDIDFTYSFLLNHHSLLLSLMSTFLRTAKHVFDPSVIPCMVALYFALFVITDTHIFERFIQLGKHVKITINIIITGAFGWILSTVISWWMWDGHGIYMMVGELRCIVLSNMRWERRWVIIVVHI